MPSRCCHREIHSSGMAQAFLMSSQLKRCVGEYCNACVHLLKIQVLHLLFLTVTMLFAVIRGKQVCRMLNCELLVSMLSEQWSVNLLSVLSEHWPVNFAVHVVRMLPCELTVHVVRMLTCELLLSMLSEHWPVNFCCHHLLTCELLLSVLSELWPVNVYCPCCQNADPDRSLVQMLCQSPHFINYCDAVLLDERMSLNNIHIFNFLTKFFPMVWRHFCYYTPSPPPHTYLPLTHACTYTHLHTLSHTPFD